MLNRTNRTLSATTLRLNLGTRSLELTSSANIGNGNTLRVRLDVHHEVMVESMRSEVTCPPSKPGAITGKPSGFPTIARYLPAQALDSFATLVQPARWDQAWPADACLADALPRAFEVVPHDPKGFGDSRRGSAPVSPDVDHDEPGTDQGQPQRQRPPQLGCRPSRRELLPRVSAPAQVSRLVAKAAPRAALAG